MDATEWLKVSFYTCSQIITGFVYHPQEDRLLDILCSTSVRRMENRGRFLELKEVIIQNIEGKEEFLQDTYINKGAIHVAATFDADSARGIGAQVGAKPYPYTEKVTVPITLQTSAYMMSGDIYRAIYHHTWQALEDTSAFLPLTGVDICSVSSGASWQAPFAAVNKEQIISLEETETKARSQHEQSDRPGKSF